MKRTRVKRSNPKRRKRLFAEDFHSKAYVEMIKTLPCALCGVEGYSEAAHTRARGAGGKASDLVPLCGRRGVTWNGSEFVEFVLYGGCHHAYDHREIEESQRDMLKARAAELWAAFQENMK